MRRIASWGDVIFCLGVVGAAAVRGPRAVAWWVGMGLVAVTFPLWIAARLQLGDSFSPWPQARRLVTAGLYRRIRHPIYVFGDVAFFGALLALQVWPLLMFWLALVPIQFFRVASEEKVLDAAFGEAYREYRRQTWF